MKHAFTLAILLISVLMGCQKNKTIGSAEIVGEWKLIEEKIESGLIVNTPTVFEPVESDKTITFFESGLYASNGEMCLMSNQASSASTGLFNPSLNSIEPEGCESASATSGIIYELQGDILIISYPCIEACQQKYKRI